jgi:hypothetical protein
MQITEADIKDLTLTASVRQASYRLAANSPIWIDLTIANNTTKPIDIDIPAIRNHAVTAIPVNGNTNVVEPLPKAYYLDCFSQTVNVPPGKSLSYRVLLNKTCKIKGRGVVDLRLTFPFDVFDKSKQLTCPLRITIEKPLSHEELLKASDLILKELDSPLSASQPARQDDRDRQDDAVMSTFSLPEDIALPILKHVLETNDEEVMEALYALGDRLPSVGARALIESAQSSPNKNIAETAKDILDQADKKYIYRH